MSMIGFPYFPISHMIECCLGSEKLETDLRTTKWSKIPTQHDFAIYNGTAVISNVSLLTTVALAVAIAASYLHPIWGVVAFTVSFWTHVSARIDCVVLSAKIRGILCEVHPIFGHFWKAERECLWLSWQHILRPVSQVRLDALPESFVALRSKFTLNDWQLLILIKGAWLGVHERNRPCLREFFDAKSREYRGNDLGSFQQNLCKKCLLEEGSRKYFSEPRTRAEIRAFLEPISDDELSESSSEAGSVSSEEALDLTDLREVR
jgi:hypothetical protein